MTISIMWKTTLFILIIGISETRKIESEKWTRTPQKDECPHLEKNENNVQLYFMGEEGEEHLCCGAPSGHYITAPCSKGNYMDTAIAKCPPGTYIADKAHNRTSCLVENVQCELGMIKLSSTEAPSRCVCPMGYFMNKDNQCQLYTPCPPEQGVVTASSEDDAGCQPCLTGNESLTSLTMEVCHPVSKLSFNGSIEKIPDLTHQQTNSRPSEKTKDEKEDIEEFCKKCQLSKANEGFPNWIVAGIVFVIYTAFIIIIVSILYYKKIFTWNGLGIKISNSRSSIPDLTQGRRNSVHDKPGSFQNFKRAGCSVDSGMSLLDNTDASVGETSSSTVIQILGRPACVNDDLQQNIEKCKQIDCTYNGKNLTVNQKTMNNLKLDLMEFMTGALTRGLFRVFTAETHYPQEPLLADIMENGSDRIDKFCRVFEMLTTHLDYEKFRPETIYKHFDGNKQLTDIIKPYLPKTEERA